MGYSSRGRKESDTTERLHFTLYGGGFGNVNCELQHSRLYIVTENVANVIQTSFVPI